MSRPRILILTVLHGSAHLRISQALRNALLEIEPGASVEVVDALAHCARWFRAYYNSFEIPLKYWPGLWEWIENAQHRGQSTGPAWLYRRGGKPLFQFLREQDPDIVVATEVGVCELAAMFKRESQGRFRLVAVDGLDYDRPWAQPEVDLFPSAPGEVAAQLEAAGVAREKILPCGVPVDPAFGSHRDPASLRARLGVESDAPLLLVLFGGLGVARPRQIVAELAKVQRPLQVAFVTRKKPELTETLERLTVGQPRMRVLGWVENLHEWMAAADLLLSRTGSAAVSEALNSGLPILGFDPPPGLERRVLNLIEDEWQAGYWVRRAEDIAPTIDRLLASPDELARLRRNALARARPRASSDAAQAILNLLSAQ